MTINGVEAGSSKPVRFLKGFSDTLSIIAEKIYYNLFLMQS
jgi:hypothetical protein